MLCIDPVIQLRPAIHLVYSLTTAKSKMIYGVDFSGNIEYYNTTKGGSLSEVRRSADDGAELPLGTRIIERRHEATGLAVIDQLVPPATILELAQADNLRIYVTRNQPLLRRLRNRFRVDMMTWRARRRRAG